MLAIPWMLEKTLCLLDHSLGCHELRLGTTEVTDHHFINEAILSVGGLAAKLRWSKYNGVLSRYIKLGNVRSGQQKLYIRTVSSIIDNFHFDLSGEKETKITEGLTFILRADAFDILNHPNFGQPSGNVQSAAFGQITSTRFATGDTGSSRQLQISAKFKF